MYVSYKTVMSKRTPLNRNTNVL